MGTKVTIRVISDGHEKDLTVTIGEQPDTTKIAKAETGESDYAFAGVAVQDLDRDTAKELGLKGKTQGVVVTSVDPESGAEKAGVMRGDVIREINRQPVTSMKDFEKVASGLKKGQNVLDLDRSAWQRVVPQRKSLTITITKMGQLDAAPSCLA